MTNQNEENLVSIPHKKQRGGVRPGAGRRPDSTGPRVTLVARIKPEILNLLKEMARKNKTSIGKTIEYIVAVNNIYR